MEDALTPRIAAGFGLFTTVVGGLLAAWGISGLRRLRRKQSAGRIATGVVVENMITTDFENSRLVHPIVEFSTLEGRRLRVQCVWSTQVKFPVGTTVQVYYDSACPEKAGIVGEGRTGAFLLIGFGATVFVFGLLWLATAMVATAVGR